MAENNATEITYFNGDDLAFLWQQILLTFAKKSEVGVGDYNDLTNRPKINDVTLSGNLSLSDLGISKAISDAIEEGLKDITNLDFVILHPGEEFPEEGVVGTFYLKPITDPEGNEHYEEYYWVKTENRYEFLGTMAKTIDLSGYLKKEDIRPLTNEEITEIISNVMGDNQNGTE